MRISDWSSDVCSSDLCAASPMEFHAYRRRHVDDVAARQELAQAEHFGEFVFVHPAALFDDHVVRHRQHAAESDQAQEQKAIEKLENRGNSRSPLLGPCVRYLFHTAPWPDRKSTRLNSSH